MKIKQIVLAALAAFCVSASASDLKESFYQNTWCAANAGVTEYVINDAERGSRVDCLTSEYAIEFDFINKWQEALSQAVYYAKMTGKKPGVVFIIEDPQNEYNYVYLRRLLNTVTEYKSGITFWFVYKPKQGE